MTQELSEEDFKSQVVSLYTDVINAKLDGCVLSFSDEWFAEANNLIQPHSPIFDPHKFVFAGKWYDGWETRRHNTEEADWVVFKFGVSSAKLIACEIDTAYFNGNHAPHISVEAANVTGDDWSNATWETVIEKIECGPSQRHFFSRGALTEGAYTHARLKMYPDGGIARFRLYGQVIPNFSTIQANEIIDYASVKFGGVAVAWSDQHFGTAGNLLLPGRGKDMGDGWETKRSRTPGHVDWAVIKLGSQANINKVIIDTAHFRGNFPQKITVHGLDSNVDVPDHDDAGWVELVGESKTQADKEHEFEVSSDGKFTHVKLTIIPDGGVKRVRVLGTAA